MQYNIKAHPTKYSGVQFRSRLEARWAAFFDLAGWEWEYEPIDFVRWSPDFKVTFPCGHSECPTTHTIFIEVKPYFSLEEFKGHPCMDYAYGGVGGAKIPADASACFGANPSVAYWEMVHGAGGGGNDLTYWVDFAEDLWKQAGNIVQWHRQ